MSRTTGLAEFSGILRRRQESGKGAEVRNFLDKSTSVKSVAEEGYIGLTAWSVPDPLLGATLTLQSRRRPT